VILALGLRFVNKRAIAGYAVVGVVLLVVAQVTFDIFGAVVELSGHGSTIEGRAELWQELLKVPINPVLGTGFESFWLGKRLTDLWALHWWHPTEAHNGYLETYLNLGVLGLGMMILLLIATFIRCKNDIVHRFEWGRFRIAVLMAVILYNWTEAAFKGLSALWFVFYIIAMEYGRGFGERTRPTDGTSLQSAREPAFAPAGASEGHGSRGW
jgi:exopolysaccharide production protein ExoQ